MRKFLISLVALSLLLAPISAMAVAGAVDVGGMPICMTVTGTSASTAADATATTRPGFVPDFIYFIEDGTDLTSTDLYSWIYGMGSGSVKDDDGAENLYVSTGGSGCWFDVSTAGSIIIDATCQQNSGVWFMFTCRYAN